MTAPPIGFHVYDTTLRDGAQQEGLTSPSRTSCPSPAPRRARGRLHRGRLAGRQPQGHRVLPPGRRRAELQHASSPRSARPAGRRGSCRRPAGARPCATRGAAVVTLVAKSHDRHVDLRAAHHARGEPRDGARHRDVPAARAGSGSSSTPSTSSTATATTRSTPSRCSAPPRRPAPRSWRCATPTAACCRPRSPTSSATSTTPSARTAYASASTATTTPAAPSPTRWRRSTPARLTCRAR